jgi:hypothetical protein
MTIENEWTEIGGGNLRYLSASKMAVGDVVQGLYTGSSVDPLYGNQKYSIEQGDGETIIVNGCGHLDFLMKGVKPPTKVRITYRGMEKMEKGKMIGKMVHRFGLKVAKAPPSTASNDFAKDEEVPF